MSKNALTPAQERKLLARMFRDTEDAGLRARALQLIDRMKLPMSSVLAKVPGDTVVEKADRIGITRQAYYLWLRGIARPNTKQSKRLAKLTGYKAIDIRGRALTYTAPTAATRAAEAARASRGV
jgi:hypothetical protein